VSTGDQCSARGRGVGGRVKPGHDELTTIPATCNCPALWEGMGERFVGPAKGSADPSDLGVRHLVGRASARRHRAPSPAFMLGMRLFSLDKPRPRRYVTPMPPPTPLPVIAQLIGLFRQGFWRRLAGRFFGRRAIQPANDPVEEFLLPILEAIAKIAAAVQNGTYREPEYAPEPPDEAPKTSGRTPPPKPAKPPPIWEPEPPWLYGPITARPRAPRPPPAPEPAERSSAPKRSRPPARQRPSWPPARTAARPTLPPPRVHIRSKKARPNPVKTHAHNVPLS
jgi:hypothetical protein